MANINFTVDTSPMARSIDGVTRHVNGVGVAVGAMGTAVALAEREAAAHICQNVDKGIYTLIRSQISQKVARLRAEVMARLMELRESGKALANMHGQMERDYHMIAARYGKLFHSINASLKARIYELERAPVSLAATDLPHLVKRVHRLGGAALIYESETLPAMQRISTARFKSNTVRAILATKEAVRNSIFLDQQIGSIVSGRRVEGQQVVLMPVLALEADDLLTGAPSLQWHLPDTPEPAGGAEAFGRVQARLRGLGEELGWSPAVDARREAVVQAFQRLLEQQAPAPRLAKRMLALLEASTWAAPRGRAS